MKLDYHAERVTDYGGITGAGLGNLLGAPKLEPLELLVREAVQNSWDARLEDGSDVEFGVEYSELNPRSLQFLYQAIFHSQPPEFEFDLSTLALGLPALLVWDRGTRGLAGPIRPTDQTGSRRDFVNFVYMIGEPKDSKDHTNTVAGGTYGYGRSAFFRASRIRCVLVHSRIATTQGPESRFIGIAWVGKYRSKSGAQYTGRHWWGRRVADWVGPLIGPEADKVGQILGMSIPKGDQTGTTIMVLDPVLPRSEEDEARDNAPHPEELAREKVVSSLVWNCWPRMIAGGLNLSLRWRDEQVEVPDPREHPRLRGFVRAFDVLRGVKQESQMARAFDIDLLSPKEHLGKLGLARTPFTKGVPTSDPSCPVSTGEPLSHVALMRRTLLVLKYHTPANIKPRDGEQFAGLFVTDREVEEAYARSEPPSHDDWVRERLRDKTERKYVNVGLKRIDEKIRQFISPSSSVLTGTYKRSLAGLADYLGALLPGSEEAAAGKNRTAHPKPGGGGGRARSQRPTLEIGAVTRKPAGKSIKLEVPFRVTHVLGSAGARIQTNVSVILAGGIRESSIPVGGEEPSILEYSLQNSPPEALAEKGQFLSFDMRPEQSEGYLRILQPRDCLLDIRMDAVDLPEAD